MTRQYKNSYVLGNIKGVQGSVHIQVVFYYRNKGHNHISSPQTGMSQLSTLNNANYGRHVKNAIWKAWRAFLYESKLSSDIVMNDYEILSRRNFYSTEEPLSIKSVNVPKRSEQRIAARTETPLYIIKQLGLSKLKKKGERFIEVKRHGKVIKRYRQKPFKEKHYDFIKEQKIVNKRQERGMMESKNDYEAMFKKVPGKKERIISIDLNNLSERQRKIIMKALSKTKKK
jgi:hypothetical protein